MSCKRCLAQFNGVVLGISIEILISQGFFKAVTSLTIKILMEAKYTKDEEYYETNVKAYIIT